MVGLRFKNSRFNQLNRSNSLVQRIKECLALRPDLAKAVEDYRSPRRFAIFEALAGFRTASSHCTEAELRRH